MSEPEFLEAAFWTAYSLVVVGLLVLWHEGSVVKAEAGRYRALANEAERLGALRD